MVGIADRCIKFGEMGTIVGYDFSRFLEPVADRRGRDNPGSGGSIIHVQIPQRSAGVLTGASNSRRISSSTFTSVIDMPAISSEGDIVSDQIAHDLDAMAFRHLGQFAIDGVEFGQWRSAHAVDHRDNLVAGLEADIGHLDIDPGFASQGPTRLGSGHRPHPRECGWPKSPSLRRRS